MTTKNDWKVGDETEIWANGKRYPIRITVINRSFVDFLVLRKDVASPDKPRRLKKAELNQWIKDNEKQKAPQQQRHNTNKARKD